MYIYVHTKKTLMCTLHAHKHTHMYVYILYINDMQINNELAYSSCSGQHEA